MIQPERANFDERLIEQFPALVGELSIRQLLHPHPESSSPALARYDLVPLTVPKRTVAPSSSLEPARQQAWPPPRIQWPPKGEWPNYPRHLDAWLGLGLACDGVVRAVCAAGYDAQHDRLSVRQIQATTKLSDFPGESEEMAKSAIGLWGGFYWRRTLVQAWIEVAAQSELTMIEIQSGEHNRYRDKVGGVPLARLLRAYDKVAADMLFMQDERTRNWTVELAAVSRQDLPRRAA